ncbi:hypothetical protein U9R90_17250 [Streptomyces sp. E11-3]|uniref:hypothetical protein n=1 Tax=Streptomyces sp. E11-3 TaxID=3110112 RepID=UPI00397EE6D3
MISTRRVIAAVALTAGASALAMPAASAAPLGGAEADKLSATSTIDTLSAMSLPPEQQGQVPDVPSQLGGLSQLDKLHQVTDLAAPVMGFVPAIE